MTYPHHAGWAERDDMELVLLYAVMGPTECTPIGGGRPLRPSTALTQVFE
ncbi:MAG: hypothetical protein MK098_05215 [Marinovum sp.]|nr:hypothetical protein [Marinovum sp.]